MDRTETLTLALSIGWLAFVALSMVILVEFPQIARYGFVIAFGVVAAVIVYEGELTLPQRLLSWMTLAFVALQIIVEAIVASTQAVFDALVMLAIVAEVLGLGAALLALFALFDLYTEHRDRSAVP